MKREICMATGLLEAFVVEVRKNRLPVHVQRGIPYEDENGTELEDVVIEHPDTGFDFNEMLSRVVNKYILTKKE